uniref:Putative secreted protein n=1 Tax=Ixodes ricinus TaxID=34613 RepID=A0A6B0U8I8_IXORI
MSVVSLVFQVHFTAQVILLPFQNHCQGAVTSAENSKYYSSLKVNRSVTKHPFLPEGDAVLSQYLKASDNFQIDPSRSASGFVSCHR